MRFFFLGDESDGTLFRKHHDGRWEWFSDKWIANIMKFEGWSKSDNMDDLNMVEIWPEMAAIIEQKGYMDE